MYSLILKYLPELSPTERLQPTAAELGTVLGVGTFGLDASMPTGTASAALLRLLAVCVRARAWVCTTPFALASLEPEIAGVCLCVSLLSCWNAHFFEGGSFDAF